MSNAGKDVEQQKLSLLVGMLNGTDTLEESLAVLTKLNMLVSSNLTLCYLHKGVETLCLSKTCLQLLYS